MKFRWTYLLAVLSLALGVSLAASCGGGGKEEKETKEPVAAATAEEEEPTAAATEEEATPEESGGPTTGPTAAFAELKSYRYAIQLNVEGADSEQGAFALNVEGAFVAPDRNQVKVNGNLGGLELQEESIIVGDKKWVKSDGGWEEGEPTFSTSDFSPASFLEDFDAQQLSALKPTKERINDVASLRYKITRADIESIAKLGSLFGDGGDTGELPEDFDIDLWLAEDGRWPVRMIMSATGTADGVPVKFDFSLDVTDVNDKSIEIESPI